MIKINLLPVRAAQKKESIRQQISILLFVLIALFAGIGFAHVSINDKIDRVDKRIDTVNIEIEQLKKKTGEVDSFKKKKRELLEKLNIIDTLSKNKTGPVLILDTFSTIIPEKMWFNIVKQSGRRIDIEGVALDNETIAVFFSSLKRSPHFRKVELVHTQQYEVDGYKLTSFRLTCDVDLSSSATVK
jgi:type IV pilus assembly protein PilN